MKRLLLGLWVPLIMLSLTVQVSAKAPKDFKLVFTSSSGALEKGTKDRVEVVHGKATVYRSAQLVGEAGTLTKESHSYDISDDQLDQLYQVVLDSGFLTWPKNQDASHQSTVEEAFEITADGKTVAHNRWESGNQDTFRTFFDRYNSWFNSIRTARF